LLSLSTSNAFCRIALEALSSTFVTMTDIEQAGAKDTTSSLIEQLGNAFLELEACKDAYEDKVQWMEVEEHFRNLETLLKKKFEELEEKEKEFEESEAQTHSLLQKERQLSLLKSKSCWIKCRS
jgi:flagellar motility protein MotE (MotC chaperone)